MTDDGGLDRTAGGGSVPPPPPAYPGAANRPTTPGAAVRGNVAAVAVIALLAVIATIVWGGGERGTVSAGGPSRSGGGTSIGIDDGFDGGQSGPVASGGSEAGTSSSEAAPTFEAAPLDPAQIAPSALLVDDREIAGAGYEWLLPGRVDAVSQRFLDVFPQPGYEIKGGLGADHPSGQTTYVYTVNLVDDLSTGPVGTMYFLADPTDPQGQTRVGLKIGR